MDLQRVLQFLHDHQSLGEPCVLVTVCAVEGSSMRNPGTIMGVAGDGSFAGSLSGGCIENAVVAEALDVLRSGAARVVRFGAGSPYLDIRLPCGGGLDLHFCPLGAGDMAKSALRTLAARQAVSICVDADNAELRAGWHSQAFDPAAQKGAFGHWPMPHITIIGHGAGVEALGHLAGAMGCSASALTPDESLAARLNGIGIEAELLRHHSQTDLLKGDPWTGFVFLFHDHDWEIQLMERALALPHFYLGAMGGKTAHSQRCETLRARGIDDALLDTIHAPIGLFHSSRDPQTLALSAISEVIRAYHRADFGRYADIGARRG